MFDYSTLKRMAKEEGLSVTDLIALSPQNDPFYVGTPNDVALARWFSDLWRRFGYSRGVHLRRVHYQIISQSTPVKLPGGEVYENTERCWDILGQASKMARYMDLVDPAAFVDRRNHEPMVYAHSYQAEPYISVSDYSWHETELPAFPSLPDYSLDGFVADQKYHLEVWCEKTTMDDVLIPVCQSYGANLIRGVGELSITATLELANRIAESGKPTRVFYISDFDPAGKSMPVAVARKAEYFINKAGGVADVRLFPIVLTEQQVQAYQLPRTPIKETERRRDGFERRFGTGATELDALEALRPGELGRLLRAHLDRYYDSTLNKRVNQVERRLARDLEEVRGAVLNDYQVQIADLVSEYTELRSEFEARLADHTRRRTELWEAITTRLQENALDVSAYPLPTPADGREVGEGLYNSRREYIEQIRAYKQFQGRSIG